MCVILGATYVCVILRRCWVGGDRAGPFGNSSPLSGCRHIQRRPAHRSVVAWLSCWPVNRAQIVQRVTLCDAAPLRGHCGLVHAPAELTFLLKRCLRSCRCLLLIPFHICQMDVEQERTDYGLNEEAQRGQTKLPEYFQARFKGAQLSKASSAPKHAAPASHAHRHPIARGGGNTWAEISTATIPDHIRHRHVGIAPSQPGGMSLSERIEKARAWVEPALEDICCLKAPTHRRSVGITCCRALSPESIENATGHRNVHPVVSLAGPAQASCDWTQLHVAGAAEVVEEAARLFSKVSDSRLLPDVAGRRNNERSPLHVRARLQSTLCAIDSDSPPCATYTHTATVLHMPHTHTQRQPSMCRIQDAAPAAQ